MYPELLRLGPFVISSYGVMLSLAFMFGVVITTKLAEKRKIDSDEVINLSFVIMISSILGARLLYVLFHLDEFEGRWIYTFWPVQRDGTVGLSGLILLGGVIGAIFAGLIYCGIRRLPVWKTADSMAPALAFGIFLGRIGCFLNGCCFGKACEWPWGIQNPHHRIVGDAVGNLHIHPTQIYSSIYGLIIFLVLLSMNRKGKPDGYLTGMFFILYGISRFTVDFFRYYESQMFIFAGLDLNQVISIIMIMCGTLIVMVKRHTGKSTVTGINA